MAKQKKVNRGPYLKNANLIGKGGGQIKPIDGSFVKGAAKTKSRPTPKEPDTHIKEHIKTVPAKKATPSSPYRGREMKAPSKTTSSKPPVKKPKKAPTLPKPKPKVIAKQAPSKKIVSKLQSSVKKKTPPKKVKPPQKKVVKKAPVKGR